MDTRWDPNYNDDEKILKAQKQFEEKRLSNPNRMVLEGCIESLRLARFYYNSADRVMNKHGYYCLDRKLRPPEVC